ncbi:MAG: ABC transporter ATP-binding protein [Bacillota bacterium]|nr:ABC transporter ATP-binding protein [Bacillota bacterium]
MGSAITTQNLTRQFGAFTAVDRLTLDIPHGEVCGFLGPNGAGKSTAIRMLCGILEPSSGDGTVLGYDLRHESEKIKRNIGYMSQKFSLYDDLSVFQNLDFYAGIYSIPPKIRRSRIEEMIELAQLQRRQKELVANLSSGFKQRLALAAAIIARPSLIFLDEPTSGVSPTSRRQFFDLIQNLAQQGTTVIVTTHFMDEAERCDTIAFINQGKLMALDSPDHLKSSIIQGHLVELELSDPMDHLDRISALPYVKECSLHGALLHILLSDFSNINLLEQEVGRTPIPIAPSLEDVFIQLAKANKGGGLTSE